jgi:putative heme-binding domain-containing protein
MAMRIHRAYAGAAAGFVTLTRQGLFFGASMWRVGVTSKHRIVITAQPVLLSLGCAVIVVATATGTPHAQHSYTAQQIQQGKALYDANCGRCHNDDGAGVTGIELFKQIRRANSDEEIARLVQTGIPGTSMPPHAFSTDQASNVVAFLRTMVGVKPGTLPVGVGTPAAAGVGAGLPGNPGRGKALFTGTAGCASCHRAEGAGGTTGPDLSTTGVTRTFGPFVVPPDPVALTRAILDPDAEVSLGFERFRVTPRSGPAVRGTLLNQDTFSVQLLDEAKNLRSFLKADLKEFGFLPSAMPSYRGRLSPQEVADVVSYLLTLKEGTP